MSENRAPRPDHREAAADAGVPSDSAGAVALLDDQASLVRPVSPRGTRRPADATADGTTGASSGTTRRWNTPDESEGSMEHGDTTPPGTTEGKNTGRAKSGRRDGTSRAERADPAVNLRPVRPLAVRPLSDRVADQIREFIISEDLAEDTRLPAERELAVRFGTSRPTVSQALRTLSLMGLVEIRPGSGAYVVHRPDRVMTATVGLMLDLDRQSIPHLAQLRLWLETVGVQEAISALRSRSPRVDSDDRDGLDDVRTAFERLRESAGNVSAWIAADTVFHATIVRHSGNPFLASIYESVHTAVIRYEYEPWIRAQGMPPWLAPGEAERLIALHEPIMAAIEAADAPAALEAVRRHHDTLMVNLRTR
ncbi:FCD domain-containing protein [Streptomyces sp. NPDC005963]|uniref:FadR/GntR family transcriptional regulator n=1 Tax=Streptomyces sp. NPDC005963 TaxID=3156721 RepID=UPI0033E182D0